MHFVVLSSSRGTTLQAVLDRIADGSLSAHCLGLISDRPDRGCVEKAHSAKIPVAIVERTKNEDQVTYDKWLQEAILTLVNSQSPIPNSQIIPNTQFPIPKGSSNEKRKTSKPAVRGPEGPSGPERENQQTILACIGWMFIFSPWFIGTWRNRMLNVHPALLPKYGGKGMYGTRVHEAVLKAGERESGMTIHLMDEGVDTGKILLQKTCPVLPGDTVETLKGRVQVLEREWYPKVLQMIERGKLSLD